MPLKTVDHVKAAYFMLRAHLNNTDVKRPVGLSEFIVD